MGRRERPVDPSSGPLPAFAHQLRELRKAAGSPSYRDLARVAHFSGTSLSVAAGGSTLPSLDVTLAYVRACGGDVAEWTRRWSSTASALGLAPPSAAPGQEGSLSVRPAQLPCSVTEFTGRAGAAEVRAKLAETDSPAPVHAGR